MEQKQTLTNSSLTTFKTCPRKFELQYVMGYVPAKDSEPLRFGRLFHGALEAWALAKENKCELGMQRIRDLSAESQDVDPYMQAKAVALLEGYHARYKDEPYTLVAAEQQFRAPLLNPDTAQASRLFDLEGVIDRIVQDMSGRVLILETKTTADDISQDSDYWRRLGMDSQVSGYYLGAEALGLHIETCLYDVIKKPELRPYKSTPVEKRQYKKDGTLYASQRETDETPDEYLERLRTDIASRPDYYYARREVPRSANDLAEYLSDAWQISQSLRAFQLKGKFPRYVNACTTVMGTCQYFRFCSNQASLEDTTLFRKKENMHEELCRTQEAV